MDATVSVMCEDGYAAVTSRRVAAVAGLNQQTIYYYFETMDDLLLATYRRRTAAVEAGLDRALAAERPLTALWELLRDPADAVLTMEFLALSNHNKLIRAETVAFGERMRTRQVDLFAPRMDANRLSDTVDPAGVLMTMSYVAHLLGFEQSLGLCGGHASVVRMMDRWLHDLQSAENAAEYTLTWGNRQC